MYIRSPIGFRWNLDPKEDISTEVMIKRNRGKSRCSSRSLQRTRNKLVKAFEESGGVFCFYCRKIISGSSITADHVIPVSKGGASNCKNLVLSCHSCNGKKGDEIIELSDEQRTIIEWQGTMFGKEGPPEKCGLIAQLVEHLILNQSVGGSNPPQPTT